MVRAVGGLRLLLLRWASCGVRRDSCICDGASQTRVGCLVCFRLWRGRGPISGSPKLGMAGVCFSFGCRYHSSVFDLAIYCWKRRPTKRWSEWPGRPSLSLSVRQHAMGRITIFNTIGAVILGFIGAAIGMLFGREYTRVGALIGCILGFVFWPFVLRLVFWGIDCFRRH